jgi:hypothetical protein
VPVPVACREKKIERKNKLNYFANRASAASVLSLLLLQAPVSRNTLAFTVVRRGCLVIRVSRKYEEHGLSRGMKLVREILL